MPQISDVFRWRASHQLHSSAPSMSLVRVTLMLGLAVLAGCQGEGPGADVSGYSTANCSADSARQKAEATTKIIMDAFEAESKNSDDIKSNFNKGNVQKLVCIANEESKFGQDNGTLFSGMFQIARDTEFFCSGLSDFRNNKVANSRCALRIAFEPKRYEIATPRWSKWPLSSQACHSEASMRTRCFDTVVNNVWGQWQAEQERLRKEQERKRLEAACRFQAYLVDASSREVNERWFIDVKIAKGCPASKAVLAYVDANEKVIGPTERQTSVAENWEATNTERKSWFFVNRQDIPLNGRRIRIRLQRNNTIFATSFIELKQQ